MAVERPAGTAGRPYIFTPENLAPGTHMHNLKAYSFKKNVLP
jgi:hypothetical protein